MFKAPVEIRGNVQEFLKPVETRGNVQEFIHDLDDQSFTDDISTNVLTGVEVVDVVDGDDYSSIIFSYQENLKILMELPPKDLLVARLAKQALDSPKGKSRSKGTNSIISKGIESIAISIPNAEDNGVYEFLPLQGCCKKRTLMQELQTSFRWEKLFHNLDKSISPNPGVFNIMMKIPPRHTRNWMGMMPSASSLGDFFSPRMKRFRNISNTPPSIHGGIFLDVTAKIGHSGLVHASPKSSPIDMEDSSTRSLAPPLHSV
eukprot:Gb_34676 [translate_table: standard]